MTIFCKYWHTRGKYFYRVPSLVNAIFPTIYLQQNFVNFSTVKMVYFVGVQKKNRARWKFDFCNCLFKMRRMGAQIDDLLGLYWRSIKRAESAIVTGR